MAADEAAEASGTTWKFSLAARCALSVALGTVLFAFYFWRFLPYSQRLHAGHDPDVWSFAVIVFLGGLLLTVGMPRRRFLVCTCLLATLCVANAIMIVIDCIPDATNHNLFPFEFALIAALTAPAYLGAGAAALVDRIARR